jgi:hypothetical protein
VRDYGKVHSSFWSSETIRALSEDGRTLALYLMTSPHTTIAGVFRLPDGYACEDLNWPSERVVEGFAELFRNGFANRCETTKWVWIVKHLDWNPPENPNQRKATAKCAQGIPANCAWRNDFLADRGEALGLEPPVSANPSATLPQPFLNQEQEQEQEQKKEAYASVGETADAKGLPRCQAESVVSLYHEVLPEMPRVKLMTESRRKAIAKLWRWVLTSRKSDGTQRATTASQALAWVRGYFEHARENDFLMGRTQQRPGHESWRCDLDFLLTERGMKHVIEKTAEAA